MKKIAIFPYNMETQVIIDNRELIQGYEIIGIISYKEDFQKMEQLNKNSELYYGIDVNDLIQQIDGILLCDSVQGFDMKGYVNQINALENTNKTIFMSSILYEKIGLDNLKNCVVNLLNVEWKYEEYNSEFIFEIDAPIVSVVGMGENCDKLPLQIALVKHLKNKGYNVLCICSNPIGTILGYQSFPPFMYSRKLSLNEKIIRFNHMLFDLVTNLEPDILILGYPSGIMKLNQYQNNFFGEIPYILSNSITNDYGIMLTYFDSGITEEYLQSLTLLCKMRLNIELDSFCIARQGYHNDSEFQRINYKFWDYNYLKNHYPKQIEGSTFSLLNHDDPDKIVTKIITKLSENLEIV